MAQKLDKRELTPEELDALLVSKLKRKLSSKLGEFVENIYLEGSFKSKELSEIECSWQEIKNSVDRLVAGGFLTIVPYVKLVPMLPQNSLIIRVSCDIYLEVGVPQGKQEDSQPRSHIALSR